jgi:hypothetical protein
MLLVAGWYFPRGSYMQPLPSPEWIYEDGWCVFIVSSLRVSQPELLCLKNVQLEQFRLEPILLPESSLNAERAHLFFLSLRRIIPCMYTQDTSSVELTSSIPLLFLKWAGVYFHSAKHFGKTDFAWLAFSDNSFLLLGDLFYSKLLPKLGTVTISSAPHPIC